MKLSAKNGVLEITLTAHQGTTHLDTVATSVKNLLVYAYSVQRGTSSNGQMSADNNYPAPTLHVNPGQTLIVHMKNELTGLSIRDYYNPAYTPVGQEIPIYPPQLESSPTNLHVHGLHVTPKGQGDNVLLDIQAGMSNTYTYHIPRDMPHGAYWYHSHLHTLGTPQTYYGMAGLIEIGRVDGNLPVVTAKHIPVRNFILQYNAIFDRAQGLAQFNNLNWSQFVSSLKPPSGNELADGTYQPSLAPVNFADSAKGAHYFTTWWAGPLAIENERGRFEFIPNNLQSFTPAEANGTAVAPHPGLPDYQRDVQFTVNGQFQPTIQSKAGQTEIWVLENLSDIAYMNVQLTETATGHHPKIAIVGQDGNPYPAVHYPVENRGRELLIPPASRYAIAVTIPKTGSLVLEMPPMGRGAKARTTPGVLYTNNGATAPAQLGNVSVLPSAMSYYDGFFYFPTQILARAVASGGPGQSTAFVEGQKLNAFTSFIDVSKVTPDVKRTILIGGGFLNKHVNPNDPKAFVYAFDNNAFPYVPLIQPRLGSVEEWTFVNHNNDEHPIHVHVNDFQVTHYHDPTTGLTTGVQMWGADNANVPAPTLGAHEAVVAPGLLTMRTKFVDFTGLYVMHCHRLNHEDNGLMAAINVIPAVSSYAVSVPGGSGRQATVRVYDGNGDRLIATVMPFENFTGALSVAMGDVEGNGVLDLIVGTGNGAAPQVAVYSGSAKHGRGAFQTEIARFTPFQFPSWTKGGVNVAAAQIDGSAADNIIVGSGTGATDRIVVYGSRMPAVGNPPKVFSSFEPFGKDHSGVQVAAGVVDLFSGRYSIVAAPGPGAPAVVKVFRFWLMQPISGVHTGVAAKDIHQDSDGPVTTATITPFGAEYRGGVSLGVGWIAGELGGAQSIVIGALSGGDVKIYSSGNMLHGLPKLYLKSPEGHDYGVNFDQVASFSPFGNSHGVRVGTTATTSGADLLVSGRVSNGNVQLVKYRMGWPDKNVAALKAKRVDVVSSGSGLQAEAVGGN